MIMTLPIILKETRTTSKLISENLPIPQLKSSLRFYLYVCLKYNQI